MLIDSAHVRRAIVSRQLQRASLVIAASLLVACSDIDPPLPIEDLGPRSDLLTRLPGPAAASPWVGPTGCTGRRWIGTRPPPASLRGSQWTSTPLFPEAPEGFALANYRVLEWTGSGDADVDELVGKYRGTDWRDSLETLAPDCVIVGPLGSPSADVLKGLRHWDITSFRTRIGTDRALPLGAHPVQIAIVDSSPDSDGGGDIPLGTNSHGYTMGWIAREMACGAPEGGAPPPKCAAEISTHLALPRTSNESTSDAGGYFGTPAELAVAIDDAVKQWKLNPWPRPRLVINLSLGWQPELDRSSGGVDAAGAAAPAQAVLEALRNASCHGALIVAAAGNEPGGEAVQPGATFPAAWQDAHAPTKHECTAYFDVDDGEPLASEGTDEVPPPSLVIAVGGTNYLGAPMAVTRPGSVSRLVAPALHGAAGDVAGPHVPALTGTSVSAAVLSGAAALVWGHRPDLDPTEVIALLYSSAIPIQIEPELRMEAYVADHPEVREVDRCSAAAGVAASCAGAACPAMPPCTPWGRDRMMIAPPPQVLDGVERWLGEFTSDGEVESHAEPPSTLQHLVTAPWVHPQPEIPPCGSACILHLGEQFLYVSIDPKIKMRLNDMVLTVRYMAGGGTGIEDTYYPVTGVEMSGGSTLGFDLSSLPPQRAVEARLTWTAFDPEMDQMSTVTDSVKLLE
ncbi:S8/S53 family peptidase [Sorangium sp. So ce233]|uniref:S8/S53 family peptidase n=1 Tax=Sorangium sp. So ce233 TaxID=3133290 RepID=UPI003F648063